MPENPQAKMWFWIGVSSITIIIFVLWAWATKISLASFNWKKTPEADLIAKSKEEWRAVFNAKETAQQSERMKLQIKNAINTIIAEMNTTTGNTSTTSVNTTTESTITTSLQETITKKQ